MSIIILSGTFDYLYINFALQSYYKYLSSMFVTESGLRTVLKNSRENLKIF